MLLCGFPCSGSGTDLFLFNGKPTFKTLQVFLHNSLNATKLSSVNFLLIVNGTSSCSTNTWFTTSSQTELLIKVIYKSRGVCLFFNLENSLWIFWGSFILHVSVDEKGKEIQSKKGCNVCTGKIRGTRCICDFYLFAKILLHLCMQVINDNFIHGALSH